MRTLSVWVDHQAVGCGQRSFIDLGDDGTHTWILHVPTLSELTVPTSDVELQIRRGTGYEWRLRPGLARELLEYYRKFRAAGRPTPDKAVLAAFTGMAKDPLNLDNRDAALAALQEIQGGQMRPPDKPDIVFPDSFRTAAAAAATAAPAEKKTAPAVPRPARSATPKPAAPRVLPSREPVALAPIPPTADPSPKKNAAPREDEFAGLAYPELLKRAKKQGYAEQPAPNAGVATMRVRNFLRGMAKKAAS